MVLSLSSWRDVIIGSRPVLKTGGRETGLVGFESPSLRKLNINHLNFYGLLIIFIEKQLLLSSEAEHLTVNQRVGISKFPGAAIKEDCQRQEFNRPVKFLNSPWSRYGVMKMDSTLTNNKNESTIVFGF